MNKIIVSIILFFIAVSVQAVEHLRVATTTSTDNSGLLEMLHPVFEAKYGVKVDVIAVGTGKALKIGSRGDVDIVFVHAPAAELKYVESGDFIDRKAVMHNDFVIVGPPDDPAGILHARTVKQALLMIADFQAEFISRGDDSGTHKKEQQLWEHTQINPNGDWYVQSGQGMGAVLTLTDEKQAYTLSDRGTHIAFLDKINLAVLHAGDDVLFNPYHVMAVNPAKHEYVSYELAKKYIEFLTGVEGQTIINSFRLSEQQLFYGDSNN